MSFPYNYSEAQWKKMSFNERALLLLAQDADNGVREATGRNDGPEIQKYQRAVKGHVRSPYCALAITWAYETAGFEHWEQLVGNGASACSLLRSTNSIRLPDGKTAKLESVRIQNVKRGDLGGWCNRAQWKGHVFIVVGVERDRNGDYWITTVEANTGKDPAIGDPRDRDGDGVYRRRRRVTSNFLFKRLVIS